MPEPPLIAVLMPFHNAASHLGPAVDSILGQTEARFELIGLDDGSTDRSAEVFAARAQGDGRLRLVRFPRQGLVATLNAGIGLAEAPYIARMDADDIALPTRFAQQVAFLEQHPECVVLGTSLRELTPDGPGRTIVQPARFSHRAAPVPQEIELAHPTTMIRRAALIRAGGYRGAFEHAEDADLWLRLLEIGDIANLPEPLLLYRRHAAQVSHRHAALQSFRAGVAKTFAVARSLGEEPRLDYATPLTPDAVARLLPQCGSTVAARLNLDLAGYCLRRPDGTAAPAQAARFVQVAARLDRALFADEGRRERLLGMVSRSVRAGDPLAATAMFALAINLSPRYTLRRLYGWLRRRVRGAGDR